MAYNPLLKYDPTTYVPPSPFDPNSPAAPTLKPNPFLAGTPEYANFQRAQVGQATDMAGAPTRPEFNTLINKDTGLLGKNLQLGNSSGWASLMKQQLQNKANQDLSANAGRAQGANAAAESSLAMRGGLGSGARTSLAKDMARNLDTGAQKINSDLTNQGLGVDIQQQQNALEAQKYNIGNSLNETLQQRGYDVNSYNEQMKAFAAQKQGQAMSGGGKK